MYRKKFERWLSHVLIRTKRMSTLWQWLRHSSKKLSVVRQREFSSSNVQSLCPRLCIGLQLPISPSFRNFSVHYYLNFVQVIGFSVCLLLGLQIVFWVCSESAFRVHGLWEIDWWIVRDSRGSMIKGFVLSWGR